MDKAAAREKDIFSAAHGDINRLRSYLNTCQVCTFRNGASEEIAGIERAQLVSKEAREYRQAGQNLSALRTYVSSCQICTYKSAAEREIERLARAETADRENREYYSARGDIAKLRKYIEACTVCAFRDSAIGEISTLEQEARTATFQVRNRYPGKVLLYFHSSPNAVHRWPDEGTFYVLNYSEARAFNLACEPSEKICYSAWVAGKPLSPYWGTGQDGNQNCINCCLTCPAKAADWIILDPQASRAPAPSLTWHFKNKSSTEVAVSFYSADRNVKWPPDDRAFVIEDGNDGDFRLSCTANQTICYGAWPSGNAYLGWGLGYGGHGSCVSCCYVCDGGETRLIELDP